MTRATQAREIVQRQQRQRDETVVERDDFAVLLSTEQGRRTAWRILRMCSMEASVFNTNAMVMSANAGKQEIGLWLQSQLRAADPDNYLKMQAENGT